MKFLKTRFFAHVSASVFQMPRMIPGTKEVVNIFKWLLNEEWEGI